MTSLRVVSGDITQRRVDAIVNAANESMLGGGGVDGAIHRAAGPELLVACRAWPEVQPGVRCPTGEARLTPGYLLAAKYVIHTVGPIWRGGARGEAALLASCYRACLALAAQHRLESIALPAISTGAFGYPLEQACAVAVGECRRFVAACPDLALIEFVAFSAQAARVLKAQLTSTA